MKQKNSKFSIYKLVFFLLLLVGVLMIVIMILQNTNFALLNPKGPIASQEYHLMRTAILLMLIIVIPTEALVFFFAWKYKAGNQSVKSAPTDGSDNADLQFIWWVIPSLVIVFLWVITWKSTHALDPFKPLESSTKPITIQVVALQWKWLFIYPEQNIATVNFIQFPEDTPISLELTADAPMNSFWIPQLGGQMYAMAGMSSKLHLMASERGDYAGSAAEISGRGFSGMKFVARASSQSEFDTWVRSVKQSSDTIDFDKYNKLAEPSENNPVANFASVDGNLYDKVIMKFMPASAAGESSFVENMHMEGMEH